MIRIWSLLAFLIVAMNASAQQCNLIPDIAGAECCESENPLACMKNMLSSINQDEGYYSTLSIDKVHRLKAEYNIQIAWIYYQEKDFMKSLRYTNEALMHSETSTEYNRSEENFKLQTLILTQGGMACNELNSDDQIKSHCEEYAKKLKNLEYDEMYVSYAKKTIKEPDSINTKISEQEQTNSSPEFTEVVTELAEKSDAEIEANNQILIALRRHIRNNPPSNYLGGATLIDTTILLIDHYLTNGKYVKECLLLESGHPHEIGEHLMGLSRELDFERIRSDVRLETTIVVQPGKINGCEYRDGIYHVYYKPHDLVEHN